MMNEIITAYYPNGRCSSINRAYLKDKIILLIFLPSFELRLIELVPNVFKEACQLTNTTEQGR